MAAFAIQATTECTDLDAGAAVCDGGEDSGGCFLESENNETVTDAEKQSDQEGVALEGTGLSNPELVIAWLTGLGITSPIRASRNIRKSSLFPPLLQLRES